MQIEREDKGSAQSQPRPASPSDCAENGPLHSGGWFRMDVEPKIGRKFIALYTDGSGAAMFWRHDDGLIDHNGDDLSWPLSGYARWAYLPDDLEFWCETGEDAMSLCLTPPPTAPSPAQVGKPMPYFCPACQAIPSAGYCKFADCPTAPSDHVGGEG